MDTLKELRQMNKERDAEWNPDGTLTELFRGNELAGETGEACNVLKKLMRERLGLKGSRATPNDLAEELADVIICADLLAMMFSIDLVQAVRTKFNASTRKHGLHVFMNEIA